MNRIVREYRLQKLRPFDKAETTAIEIVFYTQIQGVFYLVEPVAVEVIDQFARMIRAVLVDNRKGGAIDNVRDTQLLAYGFDESGLARTHRSIKGKNGIVAHQRNEVACCAAEVGRAIDSDRIHV